MSSDSAGDEDVRDGTPEAVASVRHSKPTKPKLWRFQPVQEYTDNLLILSCLEIVESGEKLRLCEIHYRLFESFHARVANNKEYKRPDELLHPHKLLEVTAFKSQIEWNTWLKSAKHGTGKVSASDPSAGLLTEEHADWASKKYEKYKLLKREIHDSVQKIWISLVPGNILPSGIKLNEKVEELRSKLFDVWKFSKTSNQSKTKYADQEMTGPCVNWHPSWWGTWKMMGPAGVRCSATFMSEFGMKIDTVISPLPDLLEKHFGTNYEANVALQSRRSLQKEAAAKSKLEAGTSALPATPASCESDAVQSRVRSMDTKAMLDVRRHEIQRLQFLIASPLCSAKEQSGFSNQLFQFMKNPVMSDFTGSFRSSPVFGDCATAAYDSTSTLSSAILMQKSASFKDAADELSQKPDILSLLPSTLPSSSLLRMPIEQLDAARPFDYDAEEEAALHGNAMPSDFDSNLMLEVLVHPTKGDGSCCPTSIFKALQHCFAAGSHSYDGVVDMPPSERVLRLRVVDWIEDNPNISCDSLGGLTFREGVRAEYIVLRRELRDSDYIRAAYEADPPDDPVQTVTSFFGWISAMRKHHAYGDEFFIAGAAYLYDCQICVAHNISKTETADWQVSFYCSALPKFRIFLVSESDHYEWCVPDEDDTESCLRRIKIRWDTPPPLAPKTSADETYGEFDSFDSAADHFFDGLNDDAATGCDHDGASDAASAASPGKPKPKSVTNGTAVLAAKAALANVAATVSAAAGCDHDGASDAASAAGPVKPKPKSVTNGTAVLAAKAALVNVAATVSAAAGCDHDGASDAASAAGPVKPKPKSVTNGTAESAAKAASARGFASLSPAPLVHSPPSTFKPIYDGFFQAMESLEKLKWPQDIGIKDSGTPAGQGIFVKKQVICGDCVGRYWGHLVGSNGLVHIKCEATTNLLTAVPDARRAFSLEHCVCLNGQPVNLFVDGSHHTGTKYDRWPNRNGIPWGALLNSSEHTGFAANCELRWLPSPAFESIREASRKLRNYNNYQGFLFARREIAIGEELRWKYSVSQSHRTTQPLSADVGSKRQLFEPGTKAVKPRVSDEDPDCKCTGGTKCKLGHCWGYGRISHGKRTSTPSTKF
jgi:hypothetical protein